MKARIRFGILGTGQMAAKFAQGLSVVEDAELVAAASRTEERARAFAAETGITRVYGSYEQLLCAKDIDVVYIATPISEHFEHMMRCLTCGKAVLCEKSFTVNAAQAAEVVALSKAKKLFLMEAMWTRFLPAMQKVHRWLDESVIGSVRLIMGDLGFQMPYDPTSPIFNKTLAGGALLSVGVYAVSLASRVFGGPPIKITTTAELGETGVDELFTLSLSYSESRMASFTVSLRTPMSQVSCLYGEKGFIRIPKFFAPRSSELWLNEKEPEACHPVFLSNGYNHEVAEVCRCLRAGVTESKTMPIAETVEVMRTMDTIRSAWGLRYPGEQETK